MGVTNIVSISRSNWWVPLYRYDSSTGTYSPNGGGLTAFDYFDDNATVGDILYIGFPGYQYSMVNKVTFNVGTAMAGTGITLAYEFYNDDTSTWDTLIDYEDETASLTKTGAGNLLFDPVKQVGWKANSVNGQTKRWIRIRISALTTITEGGASITSGIGQENETLQITGYTEATPCTFDDLYNADLAGTMDLKTRTGITAIDGTAINNIFALRPADTGALGGASLYLTITNFTGLTNATIQIAGTDVNDTAQTEDIVINANGQYNTTKAFKTVDSTQVTVITGTGSFDYVITQGRWGVVWKMNGERIYKTDRFMRLTSGFFGDIKCDWIIDKKKYYAGSGTKSLDVKNTSQFRLGNVFNESLKATKDGVGILEINDHTYSGNAYSTFLSMSPLDTVLFYACTFNCYKQRDVTNGMLGVGSRAWDCIFYNNFQLGFSAPASVDVSNCQAYNNSAIVRRPDGNTTIANIGGNNINYPVWFQLGTGGDYAKGIKVTNAYRFCMMMYMTTYHTMIVNGDIDSESISWSQTNSTATFYRMYSMNIKVVDINGNAIQNAKVTLTKGIRVIILNTDSNGDIIPASFTRIDGTTTSTSANKLIDSTATFITNGVVKGCMVFNKENTAFSYVESVDSETQLTLSDDIYVSGDGYFIEECDIEYGYYQVATGSTAQNAGDWEIKIQKPGFNLYKKIVSIQKGSSKGWDFVIGLSKNKVISDLETLT